MVSLEVGLDAQGVVTGGTQASSALSGLAQLAQLTTSSLAGTSAAAGAFGTALSAAMPWITAIGAALSGVSAGLLLFADRTNQAAVAWDKLADSMQKAQAGLAAAQMVGRSADPFAEAMVGAQFTALQESLTPGAGPISFGQLESGVSGLLGREELLAIIAAQGGNRQLIQFGAEGRFMVDGGVSVRGGNPMRTGRYSTDPSGLMVSPRVAARIFQQGIFRARANLPIGGGDEGGGGGGGGAGYGPDPFFAPVEAGYGGLGPFREGTAGDARTSAAAMKWHSDRKLEADKQANRELELMEQRAMRIGEHLGDAAFDFVTGLRDGREVLGSILLDFGRAINREIFAQSAKQIVNSFASTSNQ